MRDKADSKGSYNGSITFRPSPVADPSNFSVSDRKENIYLYPPVQRRDAATEWQADFCRIYDFFRYG